MNTKVIYSALIGGYDEVRQPEVVSEEFDYILFCNDIAEKQVGVWQIRPIEYTNPIQTKIARYVKTHPEELLPEYEFSVWMDLTVVIKSDYIYKRAIELYNQGTLIATHIHPERKCIYNEMFGMLKFRWEYENVILDWGRYLRQQHYPRNTGTWETRVLYRKHSKQMHQFNNEWWRCIETYSRRDQLSFNYVLNKCNVLCVSYLPPPCDVHESEHMGLVEHKVNNKALPFTSAFDGWLIRYYYKHPDKEQQLEDLYYWIYGTHFPHFWTFALGQCYRIYHLIQSCMIKR